MPLDAPRTATAFDPGQTYSLRLRGGAPAQTLAGRLEHVMSGRCADFSDAAQLIAALGLLAGASRPVPAHGDEPR